MKGRATAAIFCAILASVAIIACSSSSTNHDGQGQTGTATAGPAVAGSRQVGTGSPPVGTSSDTVTNADWDRVSQNPDKFKGSKVSLTGEVFNVLQDSNGFHNFQMFTDAKNGKGNTHVAVREDPRVKKGYQVKVVGNVRGLRVSRSVSGTELKIPEVEAQSVVIVGPPSVVTPTAIPSPSATPSPTLVPTVVPTATAGPPTATKAATAPPTATAQPPTATKAPAAAASPTGIGIRDQGTGNGGRGTAVPAATVAPSPTGASATPGSSAAAARGGGSGAIFAQAGSAAQVTAPMGLQADPDAPGGHYIATAATDQKWNGVGTPPATGSATMQIQVPRKGTYAMWARMWYAGADGNSFWLIVDNGPGIKVGNEDRGYSQWKWVGWHDGSNSQRITIELGAGVHTLRVVGRESGAKLASVLVTDDLTYVPK